MIHRIISIEAIDLYDVDADDIDYIEIQLEMDSIPPCEEDGG